MSQSKRTDREIEGFFGKRQLLAVSTGESSCNAAFVSGYIEHGRRTIDAHCTPTTLRFEFFQPASCAACEIEDAFAPNVSQPRQKVTLFSRQQWIRKIIVGRSPTLVALGS